jgi:hypothetical protein
MTLKYCRSIARWDIVNWVVAMASSRIRNPCLNSWVSSVVNRFLRLGTFDVYELCGDEEVELYTGGENRNEVKQ